MKTITSDPSSALATVQPSAPSESERMFLMIERMATDPQCDPSKLREILSVKQTWEADEARKKFANDMAIFQSRCPIIAKADEAYGKKYARIDRIHRETRDLRSECGFWFIWSSCEVKGGVATLSGTLGHRGGHTVPVIQFIPLPDELKGQNETQRAGSAMTYAKRYGECLALGIVTGDDDDGNAGNRHKPANPAATPEDIRIKALIKQLWELLKPVRGAENNWKQANDWMWREDVLDAAANEAAPKLTEDQFKKAIEKAAAKLK